MAAILAPHHGALSAGYLADRYGNDPFVWSTPFSWSHCHARSRNHDFGRARVGPFVFGKDAVFFVTVHPTTRKLVCDCVFVIEDILPIWQAELAYPSSHPIRHYHFDQDRNVHHERSTITRVADPARSFVPHPPAPIGCWIEKHVSQRKLPVVEYFGLKKRKNVRIVMADAQGVYDRIVAWCSQPGHQRLRRLPFVSLQPIPLHHPGEGNIAWNE